MKKFYILIFLSIIIQNFCNSQSIYLGLEYGMTQKEAKKEFKANKDKYINIDIGNGFKFRIYQQNFMYDQDKLIGILLSPKGAAFGLDYDNAVGYMEYSRAFFEKQGYELFFEPEYWNAPLNFSSKYGLLMSKSDKSTMVQMYPMNYELSGSTTYLVKLHIYNYDKYMEMWNSEHKEVEKKQDNTGF